MIYFTKYASDKFEILNKHRVFITKEEIEEAVARPDKQLKKGRYFYAQKAAVKVIFQPEEDLKKIVTFYPNKS